jgi:hypothetical protein
VKLFEKLSITEEERKTKRKKHPCLAAGRKLSNQTYKRRTIIPSNPDWKLHLPKGIVYK